nr:XrtA/PEP-CTERM system-associated ATPase [Sphingobium abikonense]
MYEQYYGLQGRPFQLTPDPHYYFESATHRKALSYLGYGLAQGEGFIVITGDIGAGKTTLVGHLMQTIDPSRLTAVKIVSTQVEGDDMLRLAAQSFGLATEGYTKAATLQKIEGYLHGQARAGRRSLLIVDEAQNLSVSAIEELRMLSNFQLGGQSLLQIFLLGQPEFRDLLRSPDLEQLRQRVIATHHLEPMLPSEVEPYVIHRLGIAGWTGNPAFTPAAFSALYAATGGVPRRLNALISRVLLLGAIEQIHEIDADAVAAVVADMGLDVDIMPEPIAASALDDVQEDAVAETVEADEDAQPVVQAEVAEEFEPVEADDSADLVDDPVWDRGVAASQQEYEPVPHEQAQDEWTPVPFTALEESDVADAVSQDAEPTPFVDPVDAALNAPIDEAAPFARPADRAPFAPPSNMVPREEEDADVADWDAESWIAPDSEPTPEPTPVSDGKSDMDAEIAEMQTSLDHFAEDVLDEGDAPAPVAATDEPVESMSDLRRTMQDEIAALRAEIASLRAVQSHAPFTPPQTIDPDALKDCFTLIEERLASLEFRAEEHDVALRRVLTMLVEWVEREDRMDGVARDAAVA